MTQWARFVSVVLFAVHALAQPPAALIGRWRSVETSNGGIGAMFEFRDDGTFRFSAGAVVEMKYRIEGDELILPPGTTNGSDQRETITWDTADRMVLGGSQTLSRKGDVRNSNKSIVGEWTTPRDLGGIKVEARYLFDSDGKCLLLIPFKWQSGRYILKGSTIRLEYGDGPPPEGPFHVDGDLLTIPNPGKSGISTLKRY